MTNRREKLKLPVQNVRQLALHSHRMNWTNYSPPVMNNRSIRLTKSCLYCYTNVPPQGCVIQMCQKSQESSVSWLHPIRNTKYMFRLLRGCEYRCLCSASASARWLEAECHHITKTKSNRLTVVLIRGNMIPLVLQSCSLL